MTTPAKKRKIKNKFRNGRGALWVIALVFFASAVVRVASGSGAAIAREVSELSHQTDPMATQPMQDDVMCQSDEDSLALIAALVEREDMLEQRELEIAQKMKAIEVARAEIQENLVVLEEAEMRLQSTMQKAQTAAESDLAKLTSVYEAMKPKEAAALFEAMSPDFAAGFLGRMRSDAAGAIMAGLKPETAYTISVILAGRNATAPSE